MMYDVYQLSSWKIYPAYISTFLICCRKNLAVNDQTSNVKQKSRGHQKT